MPQSLALGYDDFLREMAYELDWARDTTALDAKQLELLHSLVQAGVRSVLQPLIPGTNQTYEWSWARPVRSLTVRPEITGTLLKVPDRSGDIITLHATTAIFDSDVVGLDLEFDDTGHRYTISEYVRESVVRLTGSDRASFNQTTQLGDYTSGVVENVVGPPAAVETEITESDADESFDDDMVGDGIFYGTLPSTGNTYPILRVSSATVAVVSGDATAESGAFTVKRRTTVVSVASNRIITVVAGVTRTDMTGDRIRFVTSGNTYTIGASGNVELIVSSDLASEDQTADVEFDIEKDFDGSTTPVAADPISTLVATEEIFDADRHPDMVLVFEIAVLIQQRWTHLLVGYTINEVVNETTVRLNGTASGRTGNFAVAHAYGRFSVSTPPSFDGAKTVVTASSAVFTSTMVGNVIRFPKTGNKYAITKFTSTTVVEVAGAADVEEYGDGGDWFMVVGPTDLAADDAFTLVNTGGDYELPDDFAAMDGPLTYAEGDSFCQVEITSEVQIRSLRQASDSSGRPQYVAIRPKSYDATTGHVFELMLWPKSADKRVLSYRYQILYNQLDTEHKWPPGGPAYGDLYLASCLAMAEQRVKGQRGIRTAVFAERLAAMIDHDRKANRAELIGPLNAIGGDPMLPAGDVRVLYNDTYYSS